MTTDRTLGAFSSALDVLVGVTIWKVISSEQRSEPYQVTLLLEDIDAFVRTHTFTSARLPDNSGITITISPVE